MFRLTKSVPASLAAIVLAVSALPALAEGDPAKGEKSFRKCAICHAVEAGAPNKAGPNLHDVVGRKTASLEGFTYSDAMKKLGDDGHIWTPEEIDHFITDPKAMVPGTKMAFAGVKKPEERADIIAYLQSLNAD
ncbi:MULTISPECIES: c-type cytochrome [unclassified Haematobacter]|uniref:c-type cytochrome n=1 Tax=unclassified Haematobacter TaxID=2640585 RepID=UPI0025C277CF|nr:MULTISPECIES: cytochrome c family protein [unclassified Haematobacter]